MSEEWQKVPMLSICPVCGMQVPRLRRVSDQSKMKVCPECLQDFRIAVMEAFHANTIRFFGIKPRQTVCSFCHKEAGEMFSLHPLLDKAVCGECAEKVNNVLNTRLIFRQYFYKK